MKKSRSKKQAEAQIESPITSEAPQKLSWWYWLLPPWILAALTALSYYPSLNYRFQFDDIANIQKLFSIRHSNFNSLFFNGPRWIPFWLNSINYQLGGFAPFYYRLFNVSFHIVTGIFVFYLVSIALSGLKKNSFFKQYSYAIAYTTTALFLLHPVQTQTVSYVIQGRMEGLAGLFVIAMGISFLKFAQANSLFAKVFFGSLLIISGFLSCGTKEIAIVSPFLIMLLDWFFVAEGDWQSFKKRLFIHAGIFIMIYGIYLYFLKPTFFTKLFGLKMEARNNIGNLLTERAGEKILPGHFFISQFKVVLHYIVMFLWPFTISVEYDWKLVTHFFAVDCILPLMVLLMLAAIIAYLLKKNNTNVIGFCALWFVIAVAPRSSIIPSSELLTDYKTYLASFGILLLLASGIVKIFSELTPYLIARISIINHARAQYLLVTLLALPTGFLTYNRNKVWRSSEEFWSNIIENAPGKARAYNNLGVALSEQGRVQEAIPLYKKAIAMDQHYPDPRNNLAVAYSMSNKINLAIETLKMAIKMHPYYPEAYNNLASFHITKKDFDTAEKLLNVAIKLRPHYGKAYFNMGKLQMEKQQYDKALQYFKTACTKADLDNEPGYTVYANTALGLKKYDDAIHALTKLLTFKPGSIDIMTKLASAYLSNANYEQATTLYNQLVQAQPQNAHAWFNLGECYLQTQEPNKALTHFEKAKGLRLPMPILDLRIIACLEQMGRINEAKGHLQMFVQREDAPEQMKKAAHASLAKLNQYQQAQEQVTA